MCAPNIVKNNIAVISHARYNIPMLSLFPFLLDFGFFAPFLVRLVSGIIFATGGYATLFSRRKEIAECIENQGLKPGYLFATLEGVVGLVGGILFIVGLWTQLAAIALAVLAITQMIMKIRGASALPHHPSYYLLLFAISLSLMVTGPGIFAFDLPL